MTKYRIDRPSDDLWWVFVELQARVQERFAKVYTSKLITYAAELIDGASVADRFWTLTKDSNIDYLDNGMSPVQAVRIMLDKAHESVRKTRQRKPQLDIEFEVTFMVDEVVDVIYMGPFYEGYTYDEVIEGFPGAVEAPEGFDLLAKRLGGIAPARAGLSWELIGYYPPSFHCRPTVDELLAAQPTPEERREAIIKRLAGKKNCRGYDPETQQFDIQELEEGMREARAEVEPTVPLPEPLTEKDLGEWT